MDANSTSYEDTFVVFGISISLLKKKKKCLDKKTTVSVRKSGYIDYSYEKDQYQNVKAIIYSSND